MPTITVDGKPVEFNPGETIIVATTRQKIDIPYYCWHPRLSVAANCRMCLVELENAPKLVPACQTEAKEGMVVHTQNAKVKAAQRAVHEFLLINHPIDCPICDQAGECKLQDYYMKYHLTPSRMRDDKVRKHKKEPLGPLVMYDAERCIVCTRCIRFMEEVAGDRQLGVFNRGDHAVIGTFPGKELDNPYSMNTVDVCPVGALTSRAFRFKQRVWNLSRSPSVCGGCARGCNINVDQRVGVVYRYTPRDNEEVNKSWLCDEGRLTYERANDNRLVYGLVRGERGIEQATGEQALARATELLAPIAKARTAIAGALSLHATCEEAYVFGRFAKEVLGAELVALLEYAPGTEDKLLRVADKNPNRAGILRVFKDLGIKPVTQAELHTRIELGKVKALVAVGHESAEARSLASAVKRLEVFVHVAHARTALAEAAHVTLPGTSFLQTDGTWVNVQNRAQRLTPAFAPEESARYNHVWIRDLASALGVAFALPSIATIRAEMERQLPSFKDAGLAQLGAQGRVLA
jgi:NADH-quinone oxidoreductase subunit G